MVTSEVMWHELATASADILGANYLAGMKMRAADKLFWRAGWLGDIRIQFFKLGDGDSIMRIATQYFI